MSSLLVGKKVRVNSSIQNRHQIPEQLVLKWVLSWTISKTMVVLLHPEFSVLDIVWDLMRVVMLGGGRPLDGLVVRKLLFSFMCCECLAGCQT